jgi:hypothetical protein
MDWETFDAQTTNEKIDMLVMALWKRFGRTPTEPEVMLFIFGNKEDRLAVWNAS